jgi:ribosome biogenesis GTPase
VDSQGVVLSCTGGTYRVYTSEGVLEASLRGRLKLGREHVLVGDAVTVQRHADDAVTIEHVQPRRSTLRRRTPGRAHGVRYVAANLDQVAVVGAARGPEWDPLLIDRFIAVAAANELPVVMVVNKCDLVEDATPLGLPYAATGYGLVYTSVPERRGLDELRGLLAGRVSLLTGPTGVGKSSLLNALQPGLRLRTGAVSARTRAGRHTTVSAEMHPFAYGGFVVDTPGLRDVGLWGLEPQEVAAAFVEFAPHVADCRFDDCRHVQEPGCAVAAAVERGEVARSRLESYRRMLEETHVSARPWLRGRLR